MAKIPTARDARRRFKLTLSPQTDLRRAVAKIVARRSLGAPVIDDHGKVLGVLTEKDCLRLVANRTLRELEGERVVDHMSTLKGTLDADMDLFAMANVFLTGNFPVLPVLESGKLNGRIGRWDLLRQIQALSKRVEQERRREEAEIATRERPGSIEHMQRLAATHRPDQLAEVMRNRPRYDDKD